MIKKSCLADKIVDIRSDPEMTLQEKIRLIYIYQSEIEAFDKIISKKSAEKNAKLVKEHFLSLTENNKFSTTKMWKLKKKLNLNPAEPPIAKFDKNGQLITTRQGFLSLYEDEYKERLSQMPPHQGYAKLHELKRHLFELRMKFSLREKSQDWSPESIKKVCNNLKNNKARDREGLIYELFKPSNCGNDVYESLTKLFNLIKAQLSIPDFFQSMTITSIYKGKGLKSLLKSERGIFNLCKARNLMDKLLYNDIYEAVESSLSCSNAGGRRGRSTRDQLFVVYSVINEVVNGKADSLSVTSYDVMMCFDKMNYAETNNDLYDAHVRGDKFALISLLDKRCQATIKTPVGETKPLTFTDLTMQGSTFGSLKCTVQQDTLGQELLSSEEGVGLYTYKNCVDIPPVCFLDDVLGLSKCGIETTELNCLINSKIESKNLQLGADKCLELHIEKKGNKTVKCHTSTIKVHNQNMLKTKSLKYLGDIVNSEGNINDTINARSTKAIGLRSQFSSLISSIALGNYYFEIAMIFRDAMYLNSILVNSETCFFINQKNMEILRAADAKFFQICFKSHAKTTRESYYMECGKLKVNHIIAKRRLLFWHNILKRSSSELLFKIYQVQKLKPCRYDWIQLLQSDKVLYNITLSDSEVSQMSKHQFKNL